MEACSERTKHCIQEAERSAVAAATRRHLIAATRAPRKMRGCFNSHIISLAFISYVISNQMAIMILGSTSPVARRNSNNNNNILAGQDYDISENMIETRTHTYKLSSFERSLVQLVAASPSPIPAPAASRSATSVSQRVPPMNGSIFGKRSLQSRKPRGGGVKSEPSNEVSPAIDYKDIITELIEDFMASNTEGDPAETTVAFCRMIVYECNQVLNHNRKSKLSNSGASGRNKSA